MSTEALRLADLFELEDDHESLYRQAAAELRRLSAVEAERDRLREALEAALDALTESVDTVRDEYVSDWRHGMPTRAGQLEARRKGVEAHESAITAARAALTTERTT